MLKRLRVMLVALVVVAALLAAAAPAFAVQRPTRVMIVVMDQMQPGYALQYKMKNVLFLQNKGLNFPKAYVGDMASETVVSHNVMVSGMFPKHMGWADEAFRDVNNIMGYGEDAIVTSGDLGTADYVKLIDEWDYAKLGDYLHAKFPDTIVANVGQKGYQVESMAASSSDFWVRMGSKKKTADLTDPFSPASVPWTGTYRGAGGNPPAYIKTDPRFLVSVGNNGDPNDYYGTKVDKPAWLYPEDGRYVKGPYRRPRERRHLGRRRGHEDHGERALVRDVRDLQRYRQDRSHVGRRRGRHACELPVGSRVDLRRGPHAVGREER